MVGAAESLLFDGIIPVFNKRLLVPIVVLFATAVLIKLSSAVERKSVSSVQRFIFGIPTMVIYGIHPFVGLVFGKMVASVSVDEVVRYFISFLVVVIGSGICAIIISKIKVLNLVLNGNRK